MNQKNIITILLSTAAGAAAALIVCLVFFFFFYKPVRVAEKPFEDEQPMPTPLEKAPEIEKMPTQKTRLSDVNSLSVNTVYTGFYDANSECGKISNRSPKADDSVSQSYSPCRTNLTFKRNGEAVKTLVIKRANKNVKESETEEKSAWKSKITAEQFETLLKAVAGNPDFLEWGTQLITHSNCSLSAGSNNGSMQISLFIDLGRANVLPRDLNAFKELDKRVVWQKN